MPRESFRSSTGSPVSSRLRCERERHSAPLPDGLEWDKAYLVSKNRTLVEVYPEIYFLNVTGMEKDVLYWESRHCLP